jgi:hypothetical protein
MHEVFHSARGFAKFAKKRKRPDTTPASLRTSAYFLRSCAGYEQQH